MNQKWDNCAKDFQRLKGIFNFNFLGKMLIFSNQTNKKGHNCGIMCNESSIEIGEPKETLNISNRS
jgi:hypothetical protein